MYAYESRQTCINLLQLNTQKKQDNSVVSINMTLLGQEMLNRKYMIKFNLYDDKCELLIVFLYCQFRMAGIQPHSSAKI